MTPHLFLAPATALLCTATAAPLSPTPVQRFEQARLEVEALRLLRNIHIALQENPQFYQAIDREHFLQGFREYLGSGKPYPQAQAQILADKLRSHVLQQLRHLDALRPHAAQPGVTRLPNGLQYDTYTTATPQENYKARRAHRLLATIAGTDIPCRLSGMPTAVGEALYEAPRGVAWRFLLPVELLDELDAAPLRKNGIRAVEILATRESLSGKTTEAARAYFAAKKPELPRICPETAELHAERSRQAGIALACSVQEPDSRLLHRVDELLPKLLTESDSEAEELMELLAKAEPEYHRAREEMRKLKHRQIASDLMQMQQQIPDTRSLSNGILYRSVSGSALDVPLAAAKYIEEEEMGTEMYLRVQNRIIHAENDLPLPLLRVLHEIPPGTAWEIIIPPALRGKEHELPLRLRIRASAERQTPARTPILPDVI